MCWSAPVSIIFSLGLYAAAGWLFIQGRRAEQSPSSSFWPKRAKWHALIVGNIASVELSEFFIWLDVFSLADAEKRQCPSINRFGTYGVFIFGFMNWMWIISLWAYKSSNDGRDRDMFKIPLVFGVITSAGFALSLILGDAWQMHNGWDLNPRYSYNASVPVTTCSYVDVGTYKHLLWRFNMGAQPWLPSGYSWFTVALLPMFFYKPFGIKAAAVIWGVLTYAIPKMMLPAEETMSVY